MEHYFELIISAIFINNILLAKFLGNCPFLGVSRKMDTAVVMSAAVVSMTAGARLAPFDEVEGILHRDRMGDEEVLVEAHHNIGAVEVVVRTHRGTEGGPRPFSFVVPTHGFPLVPVGLRHRD